MDQLNKYDHKSTSSNGGPLHKKQKTTAKTTAKTTPNTNSNTAHSASFSTSSQPNIIPPSNLSKHNFCPEITGDNQNLFLDGCQLLPNQVHGASTAFLGQENQTNTVKCQISTLDFTKRTITLQYPRTLQYPSGTTETMSFKLFQRILRPDHVPFRPYALGESGSGEFQGDFLPYFQDVADMHGYISDTYSCYYYHWNYTVSLRNEHAEQYMKYLKSQGHLEFCSELFEGLPMKEYLKKLGVNPASNQGQLKIREIAAVIVMSISLSKQRRSLRI